MLRLPLLFLTDIFFRYVAFYPLIFIAFSSFVFSLSQIIEGEWEMTNIFLGFLGSYIFLMKLLVPECTHGV